ncbi:hypothetical protein Pcinc_012109 [Petrolisthes cinctipes]|uniref:OTU domain-containing protein n=1 Tax=Petrolisthes cinctipes TaxID=88211 RepID=A0AAE1G2F3_PETCI|nr:hypothetical protein Pcinc_012109 [Petrolisthes cinctipes]
MSDEGPDSGVTSEELIARHRKEKKELQAHVQNLKRQINKDKKKKKEVGEEIERLETELKERHAKELADATTPGSASSSEVNDVNEVLESVSLDNDDGEEEKEEDDALLSPYQDINQGKKLSRAEKRRQKKAEANREREARIREAKANNKFSARSIEAQKLKELLRERKLKMVEIQPDGNCMYAAIAHQLGDETTVEWLRGQAGHYIRENYDDFAPFITDPKTGELLTQDQFSEYCDRIENTPLWGGQPELRALSQVMKIRIEVIQAEGTPIIFGESGNIGKGILLAYYRHYYGLGEHYNSVTTITTSPEEDSTEES